MKETKRFKKTSKLFRRVAPYMLGGFLLFSAAPLMAENAEVDSVAEAVEARIIANNHVNLDSLEFTPAEKRIVATATNGLFDDKDVLTVDLGQYGETDWCYPLEGSKVISPFGGRRRHSGVDIKTCPNDDIKAVFDGVVRFAQPYYGYGNVIVIRHANGLETLYSHNSKNLVKVGDYVKAGQVIGLTGRTGRATTEHCHFEVRVNGKVVDPGKLFDFNTRTLKTDLLGFNKYGKSVNPDAVDASKNLASTENSEEDNDKVTKSVRKTSVRRTPSRKRYYAKSGRKSTKSTAKGGLYIAKSKKGKSSVGVM